MPPPLRPYPIPLRKRLFDLALTLPTLVILSPVMAVMALAIWLLEGRPIFFRQPRPGLGGKVFTVIKFRTMRSETSPNGRLLPDGERLSRLGRLLRTTSLDELPELWNILRGEMSLVGPRPLLVAYLERYSPEQARRHQVLPGLTGWAQVNGRNSVSWDEKFRLDVWYVDHWSLRLDLKILGLSVWKVLSREGINQPGSDTAEEFMGPAGPTGE
jgi:sugar transferase EpsL